MKKVIIADITTLTYKEEIFGHFFNVADEYNKILERNYDVYIAGGKTYKKYFNSNFIQLPFYNKKKQKLSIVDRFIMKLREILNCIKVLKQESEIIIFQCLSEMPVYIALLFTNTKNKKIYMIQYEKGLKTKYSKRMYIKVKNKISGVITASKEVGEYYGIRYITVPDYFPMKKYKSVKQEFDYDFVVLGTVSEWKDYEDVISSFKGTSYKVKIAGRFFDENRLNKLEQAASSNIEFENKYLTEEEYRKYILESKFVILPYKEQYQEKSSGVVLDALYRKTPVIVPNLKSFEFVENDQVGVIYNQSIKEIIDKIVSLNYVDLQNNIERFISNKNKQKDELIKFLDK